MTHEGSTFRYEVGKCVTGSPSRASASQQLHRQSKTNNMTTVHCDLSCKRSKSDMIFGANNVEWLSWFETPRSRGLNTGIAPPRTARPWPKRDSLRRRPSLAVEFALWCESNRQQLTSPASYQYESWHRKCRRNSLAIAVFFSPFSDMAGLAINPVQVFSTLPDLHWEFLRLWTGFELYSSWSNLPCYGVNLNRNSFCVMR